MSLPWVVAFLALWVLVIVLAALVLGMMRRMAPLLAKVERITDQQNLPPDHAGLPPGSEVPPFDVVDEAGRKLRLGRTLPLPAVLLFVDGACPPCKELVEDLLAQAESLRGTRLYVVLKDGSFADEPGFRALREKDLRVFEQRDRQASEAFRQNAIPQAFAVGADRRVAESRITNTVEELKMMVREIRAYGEGKEAEHGSPETESVRVRESRKEV